MEGGGHFDQGRQYWRARSVAASLPSSMGEAGGTRITLHNELFQSLLFCEGAFSGTVGSLVRENFSGRKPPDPQITTALLGDQYTKDSSSGKEFEDQNLPLWRNIYIYIKICPKRKLCPLLP